MKEWNRILSVLGILLIKKDTDTTGFISFLRVSFSIKRMQKMDNNSQPLCICQRLVKIVMSMLPVNVQHRSSAEVPIEGGSSRNDRKSSFKSTDSPNGYSSSEIAVEFRHTDVSKSLTRVNGSTGGSTRVPKKGDPILGNQQAIQQNRLDKREKGNDHFAPRIDPSPLKKDGFQVQQKTGTKAPEKGLKELQILNGTEARLESPKKGVPIKGNVEDSERINSKKTNLSDNEATTKNTLRPSMPFLRVDSNIDEISNEFIQKKKEAMTREYNLDNNES